MMAAARSMVDELVANLDWRLAVTTTDGSGTIVGGGLQPMATNSSSVNVGTSGSAAEVGLTSGRRAITNLLPERLRTRLSYA